jgi:hypothetical protein
VAKTNTRLCQFYKKDLYRLHLLFLDPPILSPIPTNRSAAARIDGRGPAACRRTCRRTHRWPRSCHRPPISRVLHLTCRPRPPVPSSRLGDLRPGRGAATYGQGQGGAQRTPVARVARIGRLGGTRVHRRRPPACRSRRRPPGLAAVTAAPAPEEGWETPHGGRVRCPATAAAVGWSGARGGAGLRGRCCSSGRPLEAAIRRPAGVVVMWSSGVC